MKIRILNTVSRLGTWPLWTFHKGLKYNAVHATNQPEWKEKGLVFAQKANRENILIGKEDYVIVRT